MTDRPEEVITKMGLTIKGRDEGPCKFGELAKSWRHDYVCRSWRHLTTAGYLGIGNHRSYRTYDPSERWIRRYFVDVIVLSLIWCVIPFGIACSLLVIPCLFWYN